MNRKKPLLETLKRIGGKLPLNEDYRDPKDNIELVQLWLTSPAINDSERANIMEQLVGWGLLDHMAQWDDLDEAVEHVLKDLGGSAIPGKYLPADMQMDVDNDDISDGPAGEDYGPDSKAYANYMKGLDPDGKPYG
jgi:hypothetical protein